MSRVQELTFKLLDGVLSTEERAELERLTRNDPAAAKEHIALMELEGALQASGKPIDVTRETMERIAQTEGSSTGQRVMDRIKQQPRPAWQPRKSGTQRAVSGQNPRVSGHNPRVSARKVRTRREANSFLPLLAAAAIALVAGIAFILSRNTTTPQQDALANIVDASNDARIIRAGKSLPVVKGDALLADDQLLAGSASTRLRYSDGTTIDLAASASVILLKEDAIASKHLRLSLGSLSANVAKQSGKPFVLSTQHATATIIGTQFTLAIEPNSTRLEVSEGRVKLEDEAKQSVVVDAGFYALAGPNLELAKRKIGSETIAAEPAPTASAPAPVAQQFGIVAFHLIDTNTGKRVPGFAPLSDGAVLKLSQLPKLVTLGVETNPREIPLIVFDLDGKKSVRREVDPPYSLSVNWISDNGEEKFSPWDLKLGKHTVTATSYSTNRGDGKPGPSLTVSFEIVK